MNGASIGRSVSRDLGDAAENATIDAPTKVEKRFSKMNDEKIATAQYVVGVDLGTTNSELAYLPLDANLGIDEPLVLEIPQFVAPSTIENRPALPSVLYVGSEEERDRSDWRLPWNSTELDENVAPNAAPREKPGFLRKIFGLGTGAKSDGEPSGLTNPNALYLVGEIASRRAAQEPERTIASAKSWLVHSRVDRRTPILPWGAPNDVPKVSPVEASRRYLAHLANAWNFAFPSAPIFDQQVVLTVPASFDESARELTRAAAIAAGFNPETLLFLEEPQAALYAWLAQKGGDWRRELGVGDVVLVCDVGGGTTDLSLIRVDEEDGDLILNRLAVGERLLLGGDNMDLALAHKAAALFAKQGTTLNPWQASALWRQCRDAKEALLSDVDDKNQDAFKISILGRSSRLVGDAVSVDFSKSDARSIVLDGFFPLCSLDERPKRRSSSGLRESGLPFETDAAIARHVAAFLKSRTDDDGAPIRPTRFLLNGGVFKAKPLETRFQEQLNAWFPDAPPTNLHPTADLDRAVARGAAYYGLAKTLGGLRIRGASARAYYVGVESAGLAIPGVARPMKALCVAPIGMEEGSAFDVPSDAFELVVGEPAVFRFFSSTTRVQDAPGDLIDLSDYDDAEERVDDAEQDGGEKNDAERDFQETDPIETTLDAFDVDGADNGGGSETPSGVEFVATRFRSVVTELGALEIWCEEVGGPRRWKLEFSVREN